jgi:phosphoribosyl 1,2-cyclic phosphodiesterase
VAAEAQASQTWLTHLSHDLQHAELEAALPARARVAFDGLKVTL